RALPGGRQPRRRRRRGPGDGDPGEPPRLPGLAPPGSSSSGRPETTRLSCKLSGSPIRTTRDTVLRMRARDETPDAPIMRAFAHGEAGAAEELYDRYAPRIYGLGMVMLGNDASAQDLVQDTFVKLLRNADRYDPARGKLDTWVLLVARSLAIDGIRRRV